MKKILQRGFTLIELLVVIAIIGILAAVVLASLNDARDGGQDASAKGSMTSVRNQAELYYNANSYTYGTGDVTIAADGTKTVNTNGGVCVDGDVDGLLVAANAAAGGALDCQSNGTAYAAEVTLRDGSLFCIDSTGFSGTPGGALGANFDCQ